MICARQGNTINYCNSNAPIYRYLYYFLINPLPPSFSSPPRQDLCYEDAEPSPQCVLFLLPLFHPPLPLLYFLLLGKTHVMKMLNPPPNLSLAQMVDEELDSQVRLQTTIALRPFPTLNALGSQY